MRYTPAAPPPLDKPLDRATTAELRTYAEWFIGAIPGRLTQLASAVNSSNGDLTWQADRSETSLDELGRWLCRHVETRVKTSAEREHAQALLSRFGEPSATELTDRTVSLSLDVGMYFGEVLLAQRPGLVWTQEVTSRRSVDYGHMVIRVADVPLNPVRVALNIAYSVAKGADASAKLRSVYSHWLEPSNGGR
jgi:hypothetical protein